MLIKRLLPKKDKLVASKNISLKDFYTKRDRVLIVRHARGIGDILMCRMMFEDFKKVMPDMKLVFACPELYHCLIKDHPHVDEVIDSANVNKNNFLISYDISTCCITWECKNAPNANKHRSDIWAEHCGVELKNHNMFLPFLDKNMIQYGHLQVAQAKSMAPKLFNPKAPNILLTPFAFDKLRTLQKHQIEGVVAYLRSTGAFVYSTHNKPVPLLEELGVPVLSGYGIQEWLSFIHAADYVITVDTSVFHYAGGIQKPMTGIFTHADGKYRGQYFDFVLVQKHKDNGNWPCGPCYNHAMCTHPNCTEPAAINIPKPCITELSVKDIVAGVEKMFNKWPR